MLSGDLTLGPYEQHWNLTSSPVRCDFAVLSKVIFAKYNSILLLAEQNESTKQNYTKRYKQHSRSYGNICISFSLVVSCFPWFVSQLCLCFFYMTKAHMSSSMFQLRRCRCPAPKKMESSSSCSIYHRQRRGSRITAWKINGWNPKIDVWFKCSFSIGCLMFGSNDVPSQLGDF